MSPLSEIINKPWYIDSQFAFAHGWAIDNLMKGKLVFEANRNDFLPKVSTTSFSSSGISNGNSSRNVSVIPIQGPLMKKDQFCGPVGMDTIARFIEEADRNPDIDAIILDINSPGGTVTGTAMLGKTIANTQKPIVAYVNELAASAAYWLASQADEIIASDEKAQVGSIGVMLSFVDLQPAWELQGVKFHNLVSDFSEEKNKMFEDIRKGNYKEYKETVLNPLAERFINTVKGARAKKITDENIFKGRVDFADKAMEIGLIDSIGSFSYAVNRSIELTATKIKGSNQKAVNSNPNQTSLSMKKYPAVYSALGLETLEMSDGGSFLNEAQLDKLEETLTANQVAIGSAAADRDQAIANLNAANTAHIEEVQSLGGQIASLSQRLTEKESEIAAIIQNGGESSASRSLDAKKDPELGGESDTEFLREFKACKGETSAEMKVRKKYNR